MKRYDVIYADPPWSYDNKKTGRDMKHGAGDKYATASLDALCEMPIKKISAANSVLFMWAVVPMMPEAFRLMEAWGFKYKTMLTWHKTSGAGLGYWLRGQCEHLLIGVRGNVKAFRSQHPNFYESGSGKHSQKPHDIRLLINDVVQASFREPAKLELFARDRNDLFPEYEYEGWDLYGNQCNRSITLPEN